MGRVNTVRSRVILLKNGPIFFHLITDFFRLLNQKLNSANSLIGVLTCNISSFLLGYLV